MKMQNTVLSSILEQTVDFRADVLKQQIEWMEKMSKHNRKCTKRDIEHMEICMIHDLAKSIGKYVVDTDVLVGKWSVSMDCGKMTISAIIKRDDDLYPFSTDVIFAGGYNIQCYHIRYIVKGGLSRIGTMEDAKAINETIKKMKKEDRMMEDIARTERYIAGLERYIAENDAKSDVQLFDAYLAAAWENGDDDKTYRYGSVYKHMIGRYGWNNMIEQAKQRYGSQDAYEAELLSDWYEASVDRVRNKCRENKRTLRSEYKRLEKQQQKLQVLLEQAA